MTVAQLLEKVREEGTGTPGYRMFESDILQRLEQVSPENWLELEFPVEQASALYDLVCDTLMFSCAKLSNDLPEDDLYYEEATKVAGVYRTVLNREYGVALEQRTIKSPSDLLVDEGLAVITEDPEIGESRIELTPAGEEAADHFGKE